MGLVITERQQKILEAIINEYIKKANPISSQFLEEEYDFGIRGAMIRREMQELCDMGYLTQPHTSAGRVPTDKAYRLYVDKLLAADFEGKHTSFHMDFEKGQNALLMLSALCKKISLFASNLTVGLLRDIDILWKEGWEEILREPEFQHPEFLLEFASMLKIMEEKLDEIRPSGGITVYIGNENPFVKSDHFSTVITSCQFPNAKEATIAVMGPIRMHYDRTIKSLAALKAFLEK